MATFVQNDQEDLTRVARFTSGIFSALGVDMGAVSDGYLTNPTDRYQVVDTYRGTATQGRTDTLAVQVAGYNFSAPLLIALAVGAYLVFRK